MQLGHFPRQCRISQELRHCIRSGLHRRQDHMLKQVLTRRDIRLDNCRG